MRTAAPATPSPTTTSLAEPAQAVLHANWREGVHRDGTPYAYTCPATPRYRHQWQWDSCFHAIAWWVNVACALSLRALARLAGDDAYACRAERVAAALLERCMDPATGLFLAMDEPSFRPGFDLWRTWRGPSWTNVAWLLTPALRELGYDHDADASRPACRRAVARDGLREYYDSRTGAGLAARGFSWSALVADLASA